jgi:hypothetical protein
MAEIRQNALVKAKCLIKKLLIAMLKTAMLK